MLRLMRRVHWDVVVALVAINGFITLAFWLVGDSL